ncbi:lysoplasmalogenase family protein [Agrococcus sp. ProA11]|uniref:lysoplasmalogenase family protein n=1 Tax=Agrococcus chionoecetis TaxID=3153752 RepID=UPI003261C0E4
MPATTQPRALRIGFGVAAATLVLNLLAAVLIGLGVGDAGALNVVRTVLMWMLMPPLALALVRIGALRHAVGRWHVLAVALYWLGDGVGATSGITAVLLGAFLLGHLAFIVSLWPTRKRSLAWSPAFGGYAFVALLAGGIIAVSAGPLAIPVLVFAVVLAAMASLAAIDALGLLGGLLSMLTVLVLGLGLFVLEIPDPLRTFAVLVPYLGAQMLLAMSLQRRLELADPLPSPPSASTPARTTSGYYRTE